MRGVGYLCVRHSRIIYEHMILERREGMLHKILQPIVCVAAFFLTLFILNATFNVGNEDMTAEMEDATLPVVSFTAEDCTYNRTFGYMSLQDTAYMVDTLTPLREGRSLSFLIDTKGAEIDKISYQVRSLDGSRLIEDTELGAFSANGDSISATVTLKDLIDENEEYAFVIVLSVKDRGDVFYHARIIKDYTLDELGKIRFCRDFSDKTVSTIEEEREELIMYIESDDTGDNSDFANVDIHSSFDQITWGNLEVKKTTPASVYIEDIAGTIANIRIEYDAAVSADKSEDELSVREYFRIRQGEERIYLLDYRREAVKIFNPEEKVFFGTKIMLGIGNSDIPVVSSPDGKRCFFVQNGSLYGCDAANNSFTTVFSFTDRKNTDERARNRNHEIKILSADDEGNAVFAVYGYMNRGQHEGECGLALYKYSDSLNSVEECVFVPFKKSFGMLKYNTQELMFHNSEGKFFFYLEGCVYKVSLENCEVEKIAEILSRDRLQVSDDNVMIAWQNVKNPYDCSELKVLELNQGIETSIKAGKDERIMPLGFMESDLVYGLARKEDIHKDNFGNVVFPMYSLIIRDPQGNILKNYTPEGRYVVDCLVEDEMLTLTRLEKNEFGEFVPSSPDTIIDNSETVDPVNYTETVITENYKKIAQLVLKNEYAERNIKLKQPKFSLFEGERLVETEEKEEENLYRVYVHSSLAGVFDNPGEAVKTAYALNGAVRGNDGRFIWRKETVAEKNQIMAITGATAGEGKSTLAVCLETVLRFNGVNLNTQTLLESGLSAEEVLEKGLNGGTVLDLTGCPLDSTLYYLNKDIPVISFTEDGEAVLLVGFNDLNTVWMNPANGNVYKVGKNDSADAFEKGGNRFITYVK